jgi:hypothetical protein
MRRSLLSLFCITAIVGIVLGAVSCASVPPAPLVELSTARTALTDAEHAGAAQAAPVELSSARRQLHDAEQLQTRDPDLARWKASEAESDARLAQSIAQDAHAHVVVSMNRNP